MRKLTIIVVSLLVLIANPVFAVTEISDATVKGLWHLDGDATDSSGNAKNGTATSVTWETASPKIGTGNVSCNGSASKISTAITFGNTSGNFGTTSLSFWYKLGDASQTNRALVGGFASAFWDQYGRGVWYNNGSLKGMGEANNNRSLLAYSTSDTGSWHHVVLINGNAGKLYLDGSVVASGNIDESWEYSLSFCSDQTGGNYFNGKLDEIAYLNRELTTTEIASLYNGGAGNAICVTVGCGATSTATTTISGSSTSLTSSVDDDALASMLYYWFWVVLVFIIFTLVYALYDKIIHIFKK